MSQDWKTYACRYYHNGKWWALDLVAQDDDDADSRARKLGNLQLLGQVKVQIPARMPLGGSLTRAIAAFQNWRSRHRQ